MNFPRCFTCASASSGLRHCPMRFWWCWRSTWNALSLYQLTTRSFRRWICCRRCLYCHNLSGLRHSNPSWLPRWSRRYWWWCCRKYHCSRCRCQPHLRLFVRSFRCWFRCHLYVYVDFILVYVLWLYVLSWFAIIGPLCLCLSSPRLFVRRELGRLASWKQG